MTETGNVEIETEIKIGPSLTGVLMSKSLFKTLKTVITRTLGLISFIVMIKIPDTFLI